MKILKTAKWIALKLEVAIPTVMQEIEITDSAVKVTAKIVSAMKGTAKTVPVVTAKTASVVTAKIVSVVTAKTASVVTARIVSVVTAKTVLTVM